MERFYKRRLLGIAHKHPGQTIAKRFFCPGWETVDENFIQRTTVENEYLVPSTKDPAHFYIVNNAIGVCSCPVGMTGAPCKHQGAVSMKFHITSLNFIPLFTPNDRMVFTYIALGYVAKENSFYASLHAGLLSPQVQNLQTNLREESIDISSSMAKWKEPNKENEGFDNSVIISFLEEIKEDYQNCGPQFCAALDKFAEQYHSSKSRSIPQLCSFLYNVNHNVDATRVKSGAMIRVQVESVKRRKIEGSNGTRRKLPGAVNEGKENLDPQSIPSRKKRKTGKKEHSLSKNVLNNQLN
ncbi:unnamed protein product [Rhizophagus irregularis]|nr:unnamed protein product [Rhizophagus irregularis]